MLQVEQDNKWLTGSFQHVFFVERLTLAGLTPLITLYALGLFEVFSKGELTQPMANLSTFGDYIFDRKNKI